MDNKFIKNQMEIAILSYPPRSLSNRQSSGDADNMDVSGFFMVFASKMALII